VAEIDVWLPRKLRFLREPHRYKVLYGGRGGIKSWSIAQSLLIAGGKQDLRIPCARETMQSIRESVHQLLEDQITRLGMKGEYEVQKAEIRHRHRNTSFTFHGLRDQSVHNIKSLEGADILWVEEAQNVSKKSWRTVIPTIRKPGSEIWVSFNPELETDDTYQHNCRIYPTRSFVSNTRARARPRPTSWRPKRLILLTIRARTTASLGAWQWPDRG